MPDGWRTVALRDLLGEASDLTYGVVQPGRATPNGVPIVRVKDIRAGRVTIDDALRISPEIERQYQRSRLRGGELLVTLVGTVGETAVAPDDLRGWNIARAVAAIRLPTTDDSRWVAYCLQTPEGRERIRSRVNTTVQTTLNLKDLRDFPVILPPPTERRAIAAVLGALDAKIESNRRLWSLTLELLHGARLEVAGGNDTTPCALGDVVAFNRSTLRPGPAGSELVYIDIASVSPGMVNNRQRLTWRDAPSRARRGVADGDIIFSTVRPGRRSFSVILDPEPGTVASTGFAVMTPRTIGTAFLLATVADPAFAEYCETVSQGSAYPAVSTEAMAKYELGVPSDATLGSIEAELMPLLRRGHRALSENEVLAELRDALLPELLSGRMRVREAEALVEDAV